MIDFITKYWIEVIFSIILTGFGAAYRGLSKRVSRRVEEQEAIKLGIQALLRDRIIQAYNHYMDKGVCPIYARDNLLSMYKQYHNLGGNGTVTGLMEELKRLPTEKRAVSYTHLDVYKRQIYSWDYGAELNSLYGQPAGIVYPEIERRVTEALMQDDRITGVDGFSFKKERGVIKASFTVHSIFGDIDAGKEVAIGV